MKKTLFLALFLIPFFGFSQNEKVTSKIETLSSKAGLLLEKEYVQIGDLTSYTTLPIKVEVLNLTDLKTNELTQGIRISNPSSSVFLDKDETDGLLASLTKMKEILSKSMPTNYTEYVFISKAGFRVSISSSKKGWSFNIDIDKYITKGYTSFEKGSDYLNNFCQLVLSSKDYFK